jgi:hypothetical protein
MKQGQNDLNFWPPANCPRYNIEMNQYLLHVRQLAYCPCNMCPRRTHEGACPRVCAKIKVTTVTETSSSVRRICMENLTIVIYLVYRLTIWLSSALSITVSRKSLTHFRFKLLQTSRPQKLEEALDFCVWPPLTMSLRLFTIYTEKPVRQRLVQMVSKLKSLMVSSVRIGHLPFTTQQPPI